MAVGLRNFQTVPKDVVTLDCSHYDIQGLIPHRGESLMVDMIIAVDKQTQELFTQYAVPLDSWWATGHFPGDPMMPGVLMAEVAAQSCAILAVLCGASGMPILAESQFRIIRPVKPGDTLITQAVVDQQKSNRRIWHFYFQIQNKDKNHEVVARGRIVGLAVKSDLLHSTT